MVMVALLFRSLKVRAGLCQARTSLYESAYAGSGAVGQCRTDAVMDRAAVTRNTEGESIGAGIRPMAACKALK